jgi:hypothetical protein
MKTASFYMILLAASGLFPFATAAQDFGLSGPAQIESEFLGAAQDFEAGVLQDSALDTQLWQGTSAGRAAQLLEAAPFANQDPIIRNILRTVILTGGVPPQASTPQQTEAYETARLQAVLAIAGSSSGDRSTLDEFLARNPDLARAPLAQVDLAFSKGDWSRACEISDTITTNRARPEWARLRAACHGLRGEISAADVTRDLLRSSGYDNPAYHAQMDALLSGAPPAEQIDPSDPLVTFLAARNKIAMDPNEMSGDDLAGGAPAAASESSKLTEIFNSFKNRDLADLQSALGNLSFEASVPDLDLEMALADSSSRATARLFVIGQSGDASAMDAFLTRAVRAGVSEDVALNKLAPLIQALPARGRAETNLRRFTRAAILSRDIAGLQQLFGALPAGPAQARIALITDALGGGFYGQALGRDIEERLADPAQRAQAVEDTQIALALGADLSDSAADILVKQTLPPVTLPQNEILLLEAAMRDSSRAEISLMTASLLSRGGLNLTDKAYLISALAKAGLQPFAGQVAADVYFENLSITP